MQNTVNKSLYYYITFFAAFGIALCFSHPLFSDPDTAWHLKAGELIISTGQIPMYDPWSFSSTQQWYNLSWAWDVFTYYIYQHFGFDGLFITQCILFAMICTAIYGYTRSITNHDDTSAIATTLCSLIIWDLLYFRPQIITYFFALAMLILLSNRDKKALFLCPIIMIAWANIHGSFLAAYSIFFVLFIQAFLDKDKQWQKQLIICGALCFAAIFINPLGYKIFIGVHRTMDTVVKMYILEWLPMTFGREYSFTLVLIILIITGGFLRKDIPISYRILAFIWIMASLDSRRFFGYFAIFGIPYICYVLLPIIKANPALMKFNNKALVATLALTIIAPATYYHLKPQQDHLASIPTTPIDFISKHCKGAHVLNDYGDGAYMILLSNGSFKHIIDGRAGTAFDEDLLTQYTNALFVTRDFTELTKNYDVNVAMMKNALLSNTSMLKYFSRWQEVYKDDDYTIYQKPGSAACKLKK